MPATASKNLTKEMQIRWIFCHSVGWGFDPVVPDVVLETTLFVGVEDASPEATL